MNDLVQITLLTLITRLIIPIGELIAMADRILPSRIETVVRQRIIAFGELAFLSEFAQVLVSKGMSDLFSFLIVVCFSIGGII